MSNLFQLNEAYRQLSERNDLDPTVLKDTLDSIDDDRKTKLENLANWADQLKYEIKRIDDKRKSWLEEKTYRQNKLNWINQYIKDVMDDAGINKIMTSNHMLSTRNFRASTIIDDTDKIPSEYRDYAKYEGMFDVDKKKLYADLKAGQSIPGAHLEPNRKAVIK